MDILFLNYSVIAFIVTLVLGTIFIVFFLGKKASENDAPSDIDAIVIKQLKNAGSNTSKPHLIEFFLYFSSKENANQCAQKLMAEDFQVENTYNAEYKTWLCLAKKRMIPQLKTLQELRQKFDKMGVELEGDYDGWGSEVVN